MTPAWPKQPIKWQCMPCGWKGDTPPNWKCPGCGVTGELIEAEPDIQLDRIEHDDKGDN